MTTPGPNTTSSHTADEAAIRQIAYQMQEGWNNGSGSTFAKPFAEDADYTVWNGMYSHGRQAISDSHQQIFDTFYRGSQLDIFDIRIRFLREDVALAHIQGQVRMANGEIASRTCPMMVLTQHDGQWRIDAFQNTPVVAPGAPSS